VWRSKTLAGATRKDLFVFLTLFEGLKKQQPSEKIMEVTGQESVPNHRTSRCCLRIWCRRRRKLYEDLSVGEEQEWDQIRIDRTREQGVRSINWKWEGIVTSGQYSFFFGTQGSVDNTAKQESSSVFALKSLTKKNTTSLPKFNRWKRGSYLWDKLVMKRQMSTTIYSKQSTSRGRNERRGTASRRSQRKADQFEQR
jgi:hypothetical protein